MILGKNSGLLHCVPTLEAAPDANLVNSWCVGSEMVGVGGKPLAKTALRNLNGGEFNMASALLL